MLFLHPDGRLSEAAHRDEDFCEHLPNLIVGTPHATTQTTILLSNSHSGISGTSSFAVYRVHGGPSDKFATAELF